MNDKPVYLLAAGGHGSVVLDALAEMGVAVAGIVDPAMRAGASVFDIPVLGGDAWLEDATPRGTRAVIELRGATMRERATEPTSVA